MTIESMKKTRFSKRTYQEWQAAAEQALKGKSFDAALKTPTVEGILLEPLYTKEMLDKLSGVLPMQTAAVQNGKNHAGWLVAQEVVGETAGQILESIKEGLARGNEMVVYTSLNNLEWEDDQLQELAALIVDYPIYFKLTHEDRAILRVFDFIEADQAARVQGVIFSEDPVEAPENVRTKLIDLLPVHNSGGSIVHELGVALSMLADHIEPGNFKEQAERLWVRFAIDTHFFQEIAKLRAFRVLWNAFCSAYGETAHTVPIFTETSVRSYSKLDPYVNLLRAGNATLSAVLGGTDAHTVHPHDFLTTPDAVSRRIARNVQLVIKEEAHVSHVIDAAAGSYFIETLTHEFVQAAWSYFLEIEQAGGYKEAVKSGWLTDDFQAKWLEREAKTDSRKASLIGTNIYANPQEAVKNDDIRFSHLEYLAAKRLATPFEKLRATSKESMLKTAVLHLGPLKDVKRQSDFVLGFLAVGGIEPLLSPELNSAEDINRFLTENEIGYAVICGQPSQIEAVLPGISTEAVLDVAGKFPVELMNEWKVNGIGEAIYSGKPLTAKLEQILSLGKKAF
ncbi:methylmalonyl-CoA mutase family protein [Planococcus sp. YIM B11945]|uniref:methylmalonyl-CoA mutase family protein n=1 Tax=Planococcus sp. YIM B11945 TaxID=3435410 RepID=UPI003D7DC215